MKKSLENTIRRLRLDFSQVERINPESPSYKKLVDILDNSSEATLKVVAGANIKWVSMLAFNRLNRLENKRTMNTSNCVS